MGKLCTKAMKVKIKWWHYRQVMTLLRMGWYTARDCMFNFCEVENPKIRALLLHMHNTYYAGRRHMLCTTWSLPLCQGKYATVCW